MILLLLQITLIAAHGGIVKPPPRVKGALFEKNCGTTAFKYGAPDGNLQADLGAQQQDIQAKTMDPKNCNLWLCQGRTFEDNKDKLQHYAAGQVIPIEYDIHFTHPGISNMSVVDTKSNKMISNQLISVRPFSVWENRFSDEKFTVTMPNLKAGQCKEPGACVLQMYWDSRTIDQTYISCIDFVITDEKPKESVKVLTPSTAQRNLPPVIESVSGRKDNSGAQEWKQKMEKKGKSTR